MNQRRPGLTGQKPSDDEVSFSFQNLEFQISGNCVKGKTCLYLLGNECLYSAMEAVICLVTSLTFMEVRRFTLTSQNRYRS